MKRSERLLNTIQSKGITPHPRFLFIISRGLLWTGFILSLVLGALAFSIVLFSIQQVDFSLIQHLQHSTLELFLGLLPFFWLGLLVFFLLMAMYALRHSPRGYKIDLLQLASYSTAMSMVLGTLFFLAGGAGRLENAFAIHVEQYESLQEKKIKVWSMPSSGYLAGEIVHLSDSFIIIIDFEDKQWDISYANASIPPVVTLDSGEKIKLIGKQTGSHTFEAETIRPWGGERFRKDSK
ncbi:MAG: hypothetical protein R2795_16070 [Saprospiraceae bacterium]